MFVEQLHRLEQEISEGRLRGVVIVKLHDEPFERIYCPACGIPLRFEARWGEGEIRLKCPRCNPRSTGRSPVRKVDFLFRVTAGEEKGK